MIQYLTCILYCWYLLANQSPTDLDKIKGINPELFMYSSMKPRGVDKGGNNMVFVFIVDFKGKTYQLPNYKRYSEDMIKDPERFDILKYGRAHGLKDFNSANAFVREKSDSLMAAYAKTGAGEIFSSMDTGRFVVFYFGDYYLMYLPDKRGIISQYWKKQFAKSKKIKDNWYKGKNE